MTTKTGFECLCGRDCKGGLTLHEDGTISFHGKSRCLRIRACEHILKNGKLSLREQFERVKTGKCIECVG